MIKTRLLVVEVEAHAHLMAEVAELSGQFEVVVFLDDAASVG